MAIGSELELPLLEPELDDPELEDPELDDSEEPEPRGTAWAQANAGRPRAKVRRRQNAVRVDLVICAPGQVFKF